MEIGKPAPPEELVDREDEIGGIVKKIRTKINYNIALIGYRRIGKSSILYKVADILSKDEKILVVYFDLQKNLGDPKMFLTALQSAIFNAYAKKFGKLKKIKAKLGTTNIIGKMMETLSSKKIKGISMEIKPGQSPDDFTIKPKIEFEQKETSYMEMFSTVFRTANALAEKNKIKVVIILDEFQEITQLRRYRGLKNVLDIFRGVIQERDKNVSFVICGSHVHTLRSILSEGKSSLFLHFVQVPIGEMDKENSILLFNKYLEAKGLRKNNSVAAHAYELVGGQPYYLMALAEAWEPKKDLEAVFSEILSSSVGSLRLYCEYVLADDLASAQGGPLLRAIMNALAGGSLGYSELANSLSVPMPELVPYVNELIKADLIIKEGAKYAVRDRIIKEYLKLNAA